MEKNYFLTYANSSLQDNPKHLNTFVSEIVYQEQHGEVYEDYEAYHLIRDAILFLIEDKEVTLKEDPSFSTFDIEKFVSLAKKIPYFERERLVKESTTVFSTFLSKDDPLLGYFIGVYDIAYQTLYGCGGEWNEFGFCSAETRELREGLFGGMFEGSQRLMCYECDQLYFIWVLLEIIRGKEYWNIEHFEYILDLCNLSIITRKEIRLKETGKDRKNRPLYSLATREFVEFPLRFDKQINKINAYYDLNPFRLSLLCSAFKSLVDFLLDNDRRKLKYCDECEKFFISKTIRPSRFCSARCRLAWHNRKRIESGEHRDYKRKKRKEGAKESYYG